MSRFEGLLARFFTVLGIVFLVGSVLVVPERAFAHARVGDACQTACCDAWFGSGPCDTSSSDYLTCYSDCQACVAACDGDPTCVENCTAANVPCNQSPVKLSW